MSEFREVIGRLESGETPSRVAGALGLAPGELVAALAADGLGDDGGGPPLVRSAPRRPGLALALSEPALAELYPHARRPSRLALAAGLLQIHDFWDASHEAAQEADDLGEAKVSAFWHGIAHRREPDPGNAAYWFRRVGRHESFRSLAAAAGPLLADDPALAGRLLPGGDWDPFAFIELCSRASGVQAVLARRLQRVEMLLLLESSMPA
ncbi:MAG: hypothetical protein LC745_01560 [Planctomycetia bacterium]|nr:hypothetical protein [Planctomycetia bacterium]